MLNERIVSAVLTIIILAATLEKNSRTLVKASKTVYCQDKDLTRVPSMPSECSSLSFMNCEHLDHLTFAPAAICAPYLESLEFESIKNIQPRSFALFKNLTYLELSYNRLTEIEDYTFSGSGLELLGGELMLDHNEIRKLSPNAFTGLSKLTKLSLAENKGINLYKGVFKDLFQLKELVLSYCDIETIPAYFFEGLDNLKKLIFYDILTEIDEQAFVELNSLTYLKLGSSKELHLYRGIFKDLPQLKELDLSASNIKVIPTGLFEGLNRLDTLSLNFNQIKNISTNGFAGLSRLNALEMNYNKGIHLYNGIFKDLTELKMLSLVDCDIEVIPPGLFKGLDNLELFKIRWNLITKIEDFAFTGLENFNHTLSLSLNEIKNISANGFAGLSRLTALDLDDNKGIYLYNGIFKDLTELKKLSLVDCDIEVLPPGLFKGMDNLETLDLTGNLVTEIEKLSFDGLKNISILVLKENKNLAHLNRGTFKSLTKLKKLDLSSCVLKTISPASFEGLDNLDSLDLFNNNIAEIDHYTFSGLENFDGQLKLFKNKIQNLSKHAFAGLSRLNTLELYSNEGINLYRGVFKDLNQLKTLELQRCDLKVLPAYSFEGMGNLETLRLSRNILTEVQEHAFSGLSELNHLDLSYNDKFNLYFGVFNNLTQLKRLELSYCGIETVPASSFEGLDNLEYLDLTSNHIKTLERKAFAKLPQLKTILLVDNDYLTSIGENTFSDMLNLQELKMQNNWLSKIEASAFEGLTRLKTLWLNGNCLTTFNIDMVNVLDDLITNHSLSLLSLHGNPWHCDCDLLPLSEILQPAHLNGTLIDFCSINYFYWKPPSRMPECLPFCSNFDGVSVLDLYNKSCPFEFQPKNNKWNSYYSLSNSSVSLQRERDWFRVIRHASVSGWIFIFIFSFSWLAVLYYCFLFAKFYPR